MDAELCTNSVEETVELGWRIGGRLRGGEVVGLIGPLGSGKTHLIKGIAEGAGAGNSRKVNSPTFVIVNEYTGRRRIHHIDVYRIEKLAEFEMLGFDELCEPDSVVLVEWADKVEEALVGVDYIRVEMSHVDENRRRICIKNAPEYITKKLIISKA